MPRPSSRSRSMGSVVAAQPKTLGPISTPRISSSTTSGTSLRGTRPAMSGARTEHSTIQKSDDSVEFTALSCAPPQRRDGIGGFGQGFQGESPVVQLAETSPVVDEPRAALETGPEDQASTNARSVKPGDPRPADWVP